MSEYLYDCPNCTRQTSVSELLVGQDVVCPHCDQHFHATAPAAPPEEKVPFFKFSRRKILKGEMDRLTKDGEYSEADHNILLERAAKLRLSEGEINKLRLAGVQEAFKLIRGRIYETAHLTDEDVDHLNEISRKYQVTLEDEPLLKMCRDIYLMEVKGEFRVPPLNCREIMVDAGEHVYYKIQSGWAQLRTRTRGYGGMAMSIPTGVKGVRFRMSNTTPVRSEELTALASGILYVTSKRLVFNGDRRNTTVTFRRTLGTSIYSDAIEIEKSTGRSDYFFMSAIHARYVSALISILKR